MESLHSNSITRGGAGGASTQKYVDVEEVRDGTIILKDGSLRAVLLVSSINFDLKATEEQDSIVSQYQNFLNSVDFPIQVMISSRKLNITPYLNYLKKKETELTNELLSLQLAEYQNFIKNLTDVSSIMSKFFYVVVPFHPVENVKTGLFDRFFGATSSQMAVARRRELFDTYKNQLWQRIDHISAGLSGTGVQVVPLKTEELIELLYNSYNPTTRNNAIIKDVDKVELK
jgi:type IV secretory pathway VirB4 component